MSNFKARVEQKKGQPKKLVIEIEMEDPPRLSASLKNFVVCSTHGNQPTDIIIDGKPLMIGLNAYYRAERQARKERSPLWSDELE